MRERLVEPQRIKSIQKGEWRATEGNRAVAGFHIPGSVVIHNTSPSSSRIHNRKDHPEQLRTWVNTFAGETFEDGYVIDHNSVMERREEYDGEVPDGVLVLPWPGVQKDRLEILVMGHGVDDEKWMVSGDIIWGDPNEEFVWNELRKIIQRPWSLHNGKEIAITASFVDSGYLTPQVYKIANRCNHSGFCNQRCRGTRTIEAGRPPKSNSQKLPVFPSEQTV